ncbi:MAG: hypothetical protein ACOVOX_12710, partial [Burkholderiaceae bacterium]
MSLPADPQPNLPTSLISRWRALWVTARSSPRNPHATEPDFWRDLRDELLAGRQWMDRGIVLVYAAITGL